MPAIQALLFCYWLLVACSRCDGAVLAVPDWTHGDNSTAQTAGEESSELEQSTMANSTNTTQCLNEVKVPVQENLRQARLVNLRAQILAKFGLSESPMDPGPVVNITELVNETSLNAYYEFMNRPSSQGGDSEECNRIKGGRSSFYAKELSVHFPASFHAVVPSVEMFEWGMW